MDQTLIPARASPQTAQVQGYMEVFMNQALILTLVLLGFLAVLSAQDIRSGTVSLWLICAAAGTGTVFYIVFPQVGHAGLILLLILCAVPLLPAVFCRGRFGAGDALILPVCVLYLGKAVLPVLLFASFAGAGAAGFAILVKKARRNDEIRFFPCLLAADALYAVLLAVTGFT